MRIRHPRYTYTKQGVYYYSRSVPVDLRHMYARPRIVKSLRTKSRADAKKAADALTAKLSEHWLSLRIVNMEMPGQNLLLAGFKGHSSAPLMSECLEQYLKVKGHNRPKTFYQGARRNVGYLINNLGDKPLDQYSSTDGAELRDTLFESGLGTASLQRVFGSIRAIINFCITENGLDCKNVFNGTYLPPEERRERRNPVALESILSLQSKCRLMDDDIRWLLALVSDTGMRLAEATGLLQSDLNLDASIPYVKVPGAFPQTVKNRV